MKIGDLTKKVVEYDTYLASVPKDEASISWDLGAEPLDPDDKDTIYALNPEDPRVKAIAPVLLKHKISQAAISDLARAFAGVEITEAKTMIGNVRAEEAKLGENHKARTDAVEAFIAQQLAGQNATPEQKAKAAERAAKFRNGLFTADQVIVLEDMMKSAAGPVPPPPSPPAPGGLPSDPKERAKMWAQRGQQNKA